MTATVLNPVMARQGMVKFPKPWLSAAESGIWALRIAHARKVFRAFLYFCTVEDVEGGSCRLPWLPPGTEGTMGLEAGCARFQRWKYLVDIADAWQSGQSQVLVKGRQLGFTWIAVYYAIFVGSRPGGRVLVISKGQMEAYAFLDRVRFVLDRLPPELRPAIKVDNEGELTFHGGGQILALPSTRNAGRGFTGALLVLDENAFHPWASQNWRGVRPAVADKGQTIVLSTANGASGHFHDLYKGMKTLQIELEQLREAIRRLKALRADGVNLSLTQRRDLGRMESLEKQLAKAALVPVFTSALARPDRNQSWLEVQQRLYTGLAADFYSEYPTTEEEAFVALTGLVYPSFSVELHVRESDPVPWEQCLYRVASYDLGGGDPTAIVVLGIYRDAGGTVRAHQYGEWFRNVGAPTVQDIAAYLQTWHSKAPFTAIFPDHRDAILANELRSVHSLPLKPVEARIWKREEGLGTVDTWLRNRWLTVNAKCLHTIAQYGQYRWASTVDPNDKSRFQTSTPFDNHADCMDAKRGCLMGAHVHLLRAPATSEPRRIPVDG